MTIKSQNSEFNGLNATAAFTHLAVLIEAK